MSVRFQLQILIVTAGTCISVSAFSAAAIPCENFSFSKGFKINPLGQVYKMKGSERHTVPTRSSNGNKLAYHVSDWGCGTNVEVALDDKKKTKQIKIDSRSCPVEGFGFGEFTLEIQNQSDQCRITKVTEHIGKKILFDASLCQLLANDLKGLNENLNRCSKLLTQMSATVEKYKTQTPAGYSFGNGMDMSNPFEAALLYAADCRRILGSPNSQTKNSLQILNPSETGEK